MVYLFIGGYLLCGVLSFGLTFAFFQGKYPIIAKEGVWSDSLFAAFIGILGPLGLIACIISLITDRRIRSEPKQSHNPFRYGLRFW